MDEIKFIAGSGILGSGEVDEAALAEAMTADPHFIAADAGSTDAGPYALGTGRPAPPRDSIKRDLAVLLAAAHRAHIPLLVGSAGTSGADCQVEWMLDIAREIAADQVMRLRTAATYSEQNKDYLKALFSTGRIRPLDPAPSLDAATIDRSIRIVGVMGVEPLQAALEKGADLVIAGRCSDSALFAAMPCP